MTCSIETWTATASSSDSGRHLAVVGEGTCPKRGYSLRLERGDPGVIPDPTTLALHLTESAPATGVDELTPAKVQYETKVSKDIVRVRIDTPNGMMSIDVRE